MGDIKEVKVKPFTVSAATKVTTGLGDGVSSAYSREITRGKSKVTVTIFEAKKSQAGNSGNDAVEIVGDSADFDLAELLGVIGPVKKEVKFPTDKNALGVTKEDDLAKVVDPNGNVKSYKLQSGARYNLGLLMKMGGRDLTGDETQPDATASTTPGNTDTSGQAAPAQEQQQAAGGQAQQASDMPAQQYSSDPTKFYRDMAEATGLMQGFTLGSGDCSGLDTSPIDRSIFAICQDFHNRWGGQMNFGALLGGAASGSSQGADTTTPSGAPDATKSVEEPTGPSLVIGNPPEKTEETEEAEAKKKDEIPKEIAPILDNMYKALQDNGSWWSRLRNKNMDEEKMKIAISRFTGDTDSKLEDVIKYWEKSQYAIDLNEKHDGTPISLIDAIINKTNNGTTQEDQYKDYIAPIVQGLAKHSNSTKAQQIQTILTINAEKSIDSTERFGEYNKKMKESILELTKLSEEGIKAKKAEEKAAKPAAPEEKPEEHAEKKSETPAATAKSAKSSKKAAPAPAAANKAVTAPSTGATPPKSIPEQNKASRAALGGKIEKGILPTKAPTSVRAALKDAKAQGVSPVNEMSPEALMERKKTLPTR